jgi:hypothetical protein
MVVVGTLFFVLFAPQQIALAWDFGGDGWVVMSS